MTSASIDLATADPRHRSFRLTRTEPGLATEADLRDIASGWARLISSDGVPVSVRLSAIQQVLGPAPHGDGYIVRLIGPPDPIEPIVFETVEEAEAFVEDLLHDD